MGDRNTIYQLQNYIVGMNPAGLSLNRDGSLNNDVSFIRVNNFDMLHGVTIRNVQPGLLNRPIDMIAARIDSAQIAPLVNEKDLSPDVVWVDGGNKQALILFRTNDVR